jgi:hypothetical protein
VRTLRLASLYSPEKQGEKVRIYKNGSLDSLSLSLGLSVQHSNSTRDHSSDAIPAQAAIAWCMWSTLLF